MDGTNVVTSMKKGLLQYLINKSLHEKMLSMKLKKKDAKLVTVLVRTSSNIIFSG